jgi:DNA-binding NarL/FixJ family response regulator
MRPMQGRSGQLSTLLGRETRRVSAWFEPVADTDRPVIIADDRPIFRRGLRSIIEQFGLSAVTEVTSVEELCRAARGARAGLVIVNADIFSAGQLDDISDPLTSSLFSEGVLLVSIYDDPARAHHMLAAGCRACVHHSANVKEIKSALSTVLAGGYYLDSRLGSTMLRNQPTEPENKLTKREQCILALIAQGLTNRQIAEQLYLSVRTVESHRAQLRKKLGLHDRSELSRFARENSTGYQPTGSCG